MQKKKLITIFEKGVRYGKMTAEEVDCSKKQSFIFYLNLEEAAASQADLIIEAVPEKAEIKRSVFETIEEHAPEHCLFCYEYFNDEPDRNWFLWKTS